MGFNNTVRRKTDTQSTKSAPIFAPATSTQIEGQVHKSDSLTEQVATGLMGNDYTYPTPERFQNGSDGRHTTGIENSHLNEGPNPGRIPRPYNDRANGKTGRNNNIGGDVGLVLNISGNSAGGLGGAMYIPHTSILRPAGKVSGSLRTIDNNAQIPAVFLADPTRR